MGHSHRERKATSVAEAFGCTPVALVPEVRPRVAPCLGVSVWMV